MGNINITAASLRQGSDALATLSPQATPGALTRQRSRATHKTKIVVVGLRGIPDISGGIETHCEYLYPKVAGQDPSDDITIVGRRPSGRPDG
jgi:hypothetical protein